MTVRALAASIPSPPISGWRLGPLHFHIYGLMYAVAIVACIALTLRRWRAVGGDLDLVYRVALWSIPIGLVGARVYHDLTSWNEVRRTWWGPLAIWEGGLGIWGGVLAGALAGVVVLRRHGASVGRFADAVAPGLLVASGIGRIGNYFNQELFGGPTNLPWGLEIDPANRPPGYGADPTFQPTFLYELIWDMAMAGLLIWLGRSVRIRPPGLFALYVAGYSLGRVFEELMRVDPSHRFLGLRLNLYVASALCLAGLAAFAWIQRRGGEPRPAARAVAEPPAATRP